MHEQPVLWHPVLGYEVAGEEEERAEEHRHQRRPGDEVRRQRAQEQHERVRHQNHDPDHQHEVREGLPRGAEPDEEVERDGVDQRDGEEVGQEDERVGDEVGREAVDPAGSLPEDDRPLVNEDRQGFGGGRQKERESEREETEPLLYPFFAEPDVDAKILILVSVASTANSVPSSLTLNLGRNLKTHTEDHR